MTDETDGKTAWRPSEITGRRGVAFDLRPGPEARTALARDLDILGIPSLRFHGRITPEGRTDFRLEGWIEGEVEQACIVTLDPVRTKIDEPVLRRFLADMPVPTEDEAEIPADDTVEQLGTTIDAADVMHEALALALPPYPRAPGVGPGDAAFGPDGRPEDPDTVVKPFADLGKLLGKGAGNE